WMIDLMPDVDGYVRSFADGQLAPIAYCRDFARRAGRRVWGVKYPGWGAEALDLILTALPRAKAIIIHRDIIPVLRSAKARRSVRQLSEAKAFCAGWTANMQFIAQLRDTERLMVIAYDDLARDAEPVLRRLEAFAGIANIDRGVLAHRVNEWASSGRPE